MLNVSRENAILSIEICRPDKKNALVPQMYHDMALALESADSADIKAVLIKGSHGCFTAGNDIADFMSKNEDKDIKDTYRFMMSLVNCPVPVVAQVEGLAIGIGTTLLLHCDFVYCDENAKFAMPFINLGLVPEYASSYILPRISGNLKAAELLLLGETFDAEKAYECGIVSKVVSSEELPNLISQTLTKLVDKPKMALVQSKALLRNQKDDIEKHILLELEVFAKAMVSEPAKEAFSAFLEKRPVNKHLFK
ncbi:enoyl-CoA hydratase-related protein [Glaciecola sp.]|jgi:enoyl-CoA hydratase/carnithine racemase|uniref:enoyl-CoA hydratase-related protein n=1 Tax=Glaciecola sp. MF2-115 TaxID=3384827 RepID=UPI003988C38A